jgi:tetratricopeptide (TPR) repeat protein
MITRRVALSGLAALTILPVAVLPGAAWAQDDAASVLAEADRLWGTRDAGKNAETAIRLLERAHASEPGNYRVCWNLSRFHYWQASSTTNSDVKARHGKTGWDYAEKAKKVNPAGVDGYYWAAANIGAYSSGHGVVTALKEGLGDKFQQNAEKAAQINSAHDDGGPLRALGRFYFSLPWPLRDYDKSRDYLSRSLKIAPKSAINLYYMAELEKEEDNTAAARALLQRVQALSPSAGDGPSIRKHQRLARQMLAEL